MKFRQFICEVDAVVLENSAHSRQYVSGSFVKYLHLLRLFQIFKTIKKLSSDLPARTVLDLGSSDALLSCLIARHIPDLECYASDFKKYPVIHVSDKNYKIIDLNSPSALTEKY